MCTLSIGSKLINLNTFCHTLRGFFSLLFSSFLTVIFILLCSFSNAYFYSAVDRMNRFSTDNSQMKDQQLVKTILKKHRLISSFTSVLSCRLREGHTIKSVKIFDSSKFS